MKRQKVEKLPDDGSWLAKAPDKINELIDAWNTEQPSQECKCGKFVPNPPPNTDICWNCGGKTLKECNNPSWAHKKGLTPCDSPNCNLGKTPKSQDPILKDCIKKAQSINENSKLLLKELLDMREIRKEDI